MRIFDYIKAYVYLFFHYCILFPIVFIYSFLSGITGWRWADGNWTFKWYRKTEHGSKLEEKIGCRLSVWEEMFDF